MLLHWSGWLKTIKYLQLGEIPDTINPDTFVLKEYSDITYSSQNSCFYIGEGICQSHIKDHTQYLAEQKIREEIFFEF